MASGNCRAGLAFSRVAHRPRSSTCTGEVLWRSPAPCADGGGAVLAVEVNHHRRAEARLEGKRGRLQHVLGQPLQGERRVAAVRVGAKRYALVGMATHGV
eukprot:6848520-Prymnesium_polylepis.1